MKANKFMISALMVAGIAMGLMTSCKKDDESEPVVTPTENSTNQGGDEENVGEIPEVDAPADGLVTMVIKVPEGSECNGIAFKGTLDGSAWTSANEYLGLEGIAKADACVKFEKIAGETQWFKATFKVGASSWGEDVYMAGKICLIYTDDSSWEGQAVDWAFIEDYSTVDHSTSDDGNVQVNGTNGLLYITIDHFKMSECVAPQQFNVTFKTPAWCDGEEVDLEVAGSMNGWGDGSIPCTKVSDQEYTASFTTTPGASFKIRGVGSWAVEVQVYDEESGEWGGCSDNVLGSDADVVIDYTNAELYRWSVCAE